MNHRRIFITRQDRERLTTMLDEALAAKHRDAASLKELAHELAIAQIVDPQDVPADVVTMNSRVVVQDEGRLAGVSPIGTAILGYAKDDVLTWQTPGGPRKIKIAAIPYQPEAAGDFNL